MKNETASVDANTESTLVEKVVKKVTTPEKVVILVQESTPTVKAKKSAKAAKTEVVKAKKVKPEILKKRKEKRTANNFDRNFSRIKFNGEMLSKGRAVNAVVADYVEKKKPTLAQLKVAFPDDLIKNYGIIQEVVKARKYSINGKTRYMMNDVIKTKDGKTIVTCNQVTTDNIKPIIKCAKTLGFVMTQVSK